MSKATDDVLAECRRQIEAEGWTEERDDQHEFGDLAAACASYAGSAWLWFRCGEPDPSPALWPCAAKWWNPKNPRRDLVRAAALLIAEIERLDRAALKTPNV